jgi:hypothetical protein
VGESVLICFFVVSLLFSGCAAFVFARLGARALWVTALVQACLAMIGLWPVGLAQTPESPLLISILMVAAAVSAIAATVQGVGRKRCLLSVPLAAIAGMFGVHFGIFAGYVVVVYTT